MDVPTLQQFIDEGRNHRLSREEILYALESFVEDLAMLDPKDEPVLWRVIAEAIEGPRPAQRTLAQWEKDELLKISLLAAIQLAGTLWPSLTTKATGADRRDNEVLNPVR